MVCKGCAGKFILNLLRGLLYVEHTSLHTSLHWVKAMVLDYWCDAAIVSTVLSKQKTNLSHNTIEPSIFCVHF